MFLFLEIRKSTITEGGRVLSWMGGKRRRMNTCLERAVLEGLECFPGGDGGREAKYLEEGKEVEGDRVHTWRLDGEGEESG